MAESIHRNGLDRESAPDAGARERRYALPLSLPDCLRATTGVGVGLAPVRGHEADARSAEPGSSDYFRVFVDNVNRRLLGDLDTILPTPAVALTFARGSVVKTRLEVANTFWPRTVECFALEKVVTELKRLHGEPEVDALMSKLRRKITLKVLRGGDVMGPAKLLVRLRRPADELMTAENDGAIRTLISDVAALSETCDVGIREILKEIDLGDARRSVRKKLAALAPRFGLDGVGNRVVAGFDEFVADQCEAGCLHPALPISDEAARRIAKRFDTDDHLARWLVMLFRFAWLCRLDRPRDFSDLTFKGIVVVPQREGSETLEEVRQLLGSMFDSLRGRMKCDAEVGRFAELYKDVEVRIAAFVVSLPPPLFEMFFAIDSAAERLDLLTHYQMGPDYAKRFVAGLLDDGRHGPLLRGIDAASGRALSDRLDETLGRVVIMKIKMGKNGKIKHKTVQPEELSPSKISALLSKALEDAEGSHLEECGWLFNAIAKDDLVGNIRGLWMDKR